MKITKKLISIPPYISTGWVNVSSLHLKDGNLIVNFVYDEKVAIPNLKPEEIEKIFDMHQDFLENDHRLDIDHPDFIDELNGPGQFQLPFKFGFGTMDSFGTAMQHNPAHAQMPNLPDEMLSKIRSIARILSPEDPMAIPKPEPHCNCAHCQIARVINDGLGNPDMYQKIEETHKIPDSELQFQQWEIKQADDKLFTVINRLDEDEKYNVFLGQPIGCTCGKEGCEHILAVLKS